MTVWRPHKTPAPVAGHKGKDMTIFLFKSRHSTGGVQLASLSTIKAVGTSEELSRLEQLLRENSGFDGLMGIVSSQVAERFYIPERVSSRVRIRVCMGIVNPIRAETVDRELLQLMGDDKSGR
jgi:hypothetical protein